MRPVYCFKCNKKLIITRRVIKELNKAIVDFIDPHTCPDIPYELDLNIGPAPTFVDKSVQKLNELKKPSPFDAPGLADKRPKDQVKDDTSAPSSVLDMLKGMTS
jgi:hypothetical protein